MQKLITEILPNAITFKMIRVESGSFMMGNVEEDAFFYEKPVHKVNLDEFYIAEYPVTQALWKAVMDENPALYKGDNLPMENVSWHDAHIFLQKLNKITEKEYRLPSESEWEFAARGGIHSEGYLYSGSDRLKEVGWSKENSDNKIHPVGLKQANELGLYDMSGNIDEWVKDYYHDSYKKATDDGSPRNDKDLKIDRDRVVVRGGAIIDKPRYCQTTSRSKTEPENRHSHLGFRIVFSSQTKETTNRREVDKNLNMIANRFLKFLKQISGQLLRRCS